MSQETDFVWTTEICYRPIGFVRSPFTTPHGMPRQSWRATATAGSIIIADEYIAGLADLADFSHIIVLSHLHHSDDFDLQVTPPSQDVERGLFATRSPRRPNPIGLSIMKLESIAGARLDVTEIDLTDGTPVLDIKPYVGEYRHYRDARLGWLEHSAGEAGREKS